MDNIVGYVEQIGSQNYFEKTIEKFLCRITFEKYSFDKLIITVNSSELKEKDLKKLVDRIRKRKIERIALSNDFIKWRDFFSTQEVLVFDGKYLMKNLLKSIILYIYQNKNEDICNEDLYVTIDNDRDSDIIIDVASLFKSLNIVTNRLKKLKRLDNKLESTSDIVYSISNNVKKGLRRAKIIVNFDYNYKFFSEAKLNRQAIIINLNNENLLLKNTFKGLIVDNIDITYKQNCVEREIFNKFNKTIVLESNMYGKSYKNIIESCKMFDCKIANLIGMNGFISLKEIKNILS